MSKVIPINKTNDREQRIEAMMKQCNCTREEAENLINKQDQLAAAFAYCLALVK